MTLKSFDDGTSMEARQFLLDRRNERKHPKRHRTLGRRLRMKAAKRAKVKARISAMKNDRAKYLEASRLYWSGESNGHPE